MVTLGPREGSLRSGRTALGDNPNPKLKVSNVKIPAGDPLDDAHRRATPVFDVPVSRAIDATSPDGLYPQRSLPCDFLLFCDGSVGCYPCAETEAQPVALADWVHWRYALAVLGVTPPWTREEFKDFDQWLVAMIGEAEAGYINDAKYPLPRSTLTVDYRLPSPEPGCWARQASIREWSGCGR